ncbi:DUF3500 domain-containing protein [Streptomyces thinghirensis]|nr:DUF3500 domain-containing protein [Streptomyces thinghirensis]
MDDGHAAGEDEGGGGAPRRHVLLLDRRDQGLIRVLLPRAQPGRAHRVRRPVPAGLRRERPDGRRRWHSPAASRPACRAECPAAAPAVAWVAPPPQHIHTIIRTPNGNDYGVDLLKLHLETDH